MSITELTQSFWAIARYARHLTPEDELDSKPTDLEIHLCRCQKHTGVLGEIVDIQSSTLPLVIAQALFHGHNLDHLQSH